jgi:hypothetical protein
MLTYEQIGERLGMTMQGAYEAVKRAIADIPKDGAEEVLKMELKKLDYLESRAAEVLDKKHYHVTPGGKLVDLDGEILEDDAPVLQAIQTLVKIADRRARLLGLNAPTRTELTGKDGAPIQVEAIKERLELFLESLNG